MSRLHAWLLKTPYQVWFRRGLATIVLAVYFESAQWLALRGPEPTPTLASVLRWLLVIQCVRVIYGLVSHMDNE